MSFIEWARSLISSWIDALKVKCYACGGANLEVWDDNDYCQDCGAKNG